MKNGFTLIEVIITLGILFVIAGFGLFVSMDVFRSRDFNGERDAIVSVLDKARNQAMNNIDGLPHGVHFDTDNYVLFEGAMYASTSSGNIKIPVSSKVHHSGLGEVIFTQLTGNPNVIGNIILTDDTPTHTSTISLNAEGRIDW